MTTLEIPEGARAVRLHGKVAAGRVALVDAADLELVQGHRWVTLETKQNGAESRNSGPYAVTRVTDRWRPLLMHNLIMGRKGIDHINHNGLDNRRCNLRPATRAQNSANSRPALGCSSRYKGVTRRCDTGKWRARIRIDDHLINLGNFADETDAARAYDAAALSAWGEYACLNFPIPDDPAA